MRKVKNGLIYLRALFGKKDSQKRIIALHDVKDPKLFREYMSSLREDFNVVDLKTLLKPETSSGIALTFDDGYQEWSQEVLSVLEELKIPAIFFINSGILDLSENDWLNFKENRLLRKRNLSPLKSNEAKKLSQSAFASLGSHSKDHLNLAILSEAEMKEQIDSDLKTLNALTDEPISFFAFPFGSREHISNEAIDFLKNHQSIRHSFSIIPENIKGKEDDFLLGRSSLTFEEPYSLWKARILGGADKP
jgi:peptidoglycan/xylan/chitin deacetylase (PgdA/CDA1 family)